MFGTLRLFLAFVVVCGHLEVRPLWFIIASVSAVVVFFIVSGYVITALLDRNRASGRGAAYFYAERALRIFPLYWAFLALAFVAMIAVRPDDGLVAGPVTGFGILANITAFPMSAWRVVPDLQTWALIPPSWSLAVELQFYLVAPLFLLWPGRRLVVFGLSLVAYAIVATGSAETTALGIQFLPCIIWALCAGGIIHDVRHRKSRLAPFSICYLAVLLTFSFLAGSRLLNEHTAPVLLGFLAGAPIVLLLSRYRSVRLDAILGAASYGVFISHWSVMWLMNAVQPYRVLEGLAAGCYVIIALAVSFGLGLLAHVAIEQPIRAWRVALVRPAQDLNLRPSV